MDDFLNKLLVGVGLLLAGLCIVYWRENIALDSAAIPSVQEDIVEWNGYRYIMDARARFETAGTVESLSPNGSAFCSGPFVGGPGIVFGLAIDARQHVSFSAFGNEQVGTRLKSLGIGDRIRISGTEGRVLIWRDSQLAGSVKPYGHWWSLGRMRVIHVKRLDFLSGKP